MSDEIYVNIGTTFQQPYQAQQPAIGQTPANVQSVKQAIANAQTPFTYQNRQPSIYRNPVNAQSPYIANAQQPYRHPLSANYPFIANAQTPYPYIANAQTPYIANARQPSTYARQGQQPYPYIANAQSPFTYQGRQPGIYRHPANSQSPFTYQNRQPGIYRHPTSYQTPYIANAQYSAQQPANKQSPYIANGQSPYIANKQTTASYIASNPSTYTYDLLHATVRFVVQLRSYNYFQYYQGFSDGIGIVGGTSVGFEYEPATNPAFAGVLSTTSTYIMMYKSDPSPSNLSTKNYLLYTGSVDLGPAGFTKVEITHAPSSTPEPGVTSNPSVISVPSTHTGSLNMGTYNYAAPNQQVRLRFYK